MTDETRAAGPSDTQGTPGGAGETGAGGAAPGDPPQPPQPPTPQPGPAGNAGAPTRALEDVTAALDRQVGALGVQVAALDQQIKALPAASKGAPVEHRTWERLVAGPSRAFFSKPRPIATMILVVVIAIALVLGARLLNAGARDLTVMATAVGGLATVTVGLMLARDAGQLLYDREKHASGDDASSSALTRVARDIVETQAIVSEKASVASAERGVGIATVDLNTLLPKLITTAAGLAIALVLLGMLMLLGASAAAPGSSPSASVSPAPSAEVSPNPSAGISPTSSVQVSPTPKP